MTRGAGVMTFREAVKRFETASPWLDERHAPAVVALRAMAAQLDGGDMAPALLGQFGLAYRALQKERPVERSTDPLSEALAEAKAG